jgi:hypothetical protein
VFRSARAFRLFHTLGHCCINTDCRRCSESYCTFRPFLSEVSILLQQDSAIMGGVCYLAPVPNCSTNSGLHCHSGSHERRRQIMAWQSCDMFSSSYRASGQCPSCRVYCKTFRRVDSVRNAGLLVRRQGLALSIGPQLRFHLKTGTEPSL